MHGNDSSPPRSIHGSPIVTFSPCGSPPTTPKRSRVSCIEVNGGYPLGICTISRFRTPTKPKEQGFASPRRTSKITSPRFSPYARSPNSHAEFKGLRARRRGFLKAWEIEKDLEELRDSLEGLNLRGYSKFTFAEPGWETPQAVYEKKWHVLVMAEDEPESAYTACVTFADFPWPIENPNFEPISARNFPDYLKSMDTFLYNPDRLSRRKLTYEKLEDEERFRWDPRAIEDRVLNKVIPEDREAVREAAALVVGSLYGLPDDDLFVSGARTRLALMSERMANSHGQSSQKRVGFEVFLESLQNEKLKQSCSARLEKPKPTDPHEEIYSIREHILRRLETGFGGL